MAVRSGRESGSAFQDGTLLVIVVSDDCPDRPLGVGTTDFPGTYSAETECAVLRQPLRSIAPAPHSNSSRDEPVTSSAAELATR